jgi:hypothetical protein
MATLTSTFALVIDDPVYVQVTATNSYGTSVISTRNSIGALARTVPAAMQAPTGGV